MAAPGNSKSAAARPIAAPPVAVMHHAHSIVLVRWLLIVATAYLVLFSRPLAEVTPGAALFIAAYLGSNVVVTEVLPRLRGMLRLECVLVVIDVAALSLAIVLTEHATHDLFVLYFAVLFLSALSERIGLVVGAAMLVTVAHLYTLSQYEDLGVLLQHGYMLWIPFLFAVALFFGHLVQQARQRERTAEEAQRREQRVDALSALSHDLKNPLGVIESLAELLLDGNAGDLNSQQADLTRRIHASARQTLVLSQNVIDAERVESGHLLLVRRPANLARVIDNALVVASSAGEIKGVALDAWVDPTLPAISMDAPQIERVVANLLGNAIKFTPAGGSVRLSARRQREEVQVTIVDDGPGIPPEELSRLAERHFRGAEARAVDGSGLGLFIVRSIVRAHGGEVRFASRIGHGTAVTVALPIGSGDPEPALPDGLLAAQLA